MSILRRLFGRKQAAETESEFVTTLLRMAREHPLVASTEHDAKERVVRMTTLDGYSHPFNYGNTELEYMRTPVAERDVRLRGIIDGLFNHSVPDAFDDARDRLLPMLRPQHFAHICGLQMVVEGTSKEFGPDRPAPMLRRPLCPGLLLMIACDAEHTLGMVMESSQKSWGVPLAELERLAIKNLRDRSPDPPAPLGGGIYRSPYDDSYDCARALLTDWVAKAPIEGEQIVTVPARGKLLIAGEEQVPQLLERTEELLRSEPRTLSARPYRVEKYGLSPYVVSEGHPSFPSIQRATFFDESIAYGEQKELVDAVHAKDGTDVFVASYTIYRKDDVMYSSAVWGENVETYLPQVDRVFIAFEDLDRAPSWRERSCDEPLAEDEEVDPDRWPVGKGDPDTGRD